MNYQEGGEEKTKGAMYMQNVDHVTKQSTTEYGMPNPRNLPTSESIERPEFSDILDPVQELYLGPDCIADAEERLAEYELKMDMLLYSKDVMYHTVNLELMKRNPTATAAKVKSMVITDERLQHIESEIQKTKSKLRAAKIYFNKMNNKFISARKLTSQQV